MDAARTCIVFYENKALKSSYEMKVDIKKNRLWVYTSYGNYSAYSEPATFKKVARLIEIDISLKRKTYDIDLANLYQGKHFINDLAFDDKDNIYITHSYSPVIYKVDAKGNDSVFTESSLFLGEDVGLNSILYHPQEFLLVANDRKGVLYQVELSNLKISAK